MIQFMRIRYSLLCICVWQITWSQAPALKGADESTSSVTHVNGLVTQVPRLITSIVFDGYVQENEWNGIDTISLVSHWPVFDSRPNAHTLLRVAYDDTYFYFSAMCFDNPELIQGPFFERDNWGMSMDQITIILDTYNDDENGNIFVVTPTGSRIDVSSKNDGQGMEPIDISWNSFWEAKVQLSSEGWSVEGRIPFSSLRFQQVDDKVSMGLIVYRYVARERQMDIYPNIPPEWGFWSFLKSSQAQDVSFAGIQNSRPWFTSPYILAGLGHHHEQPEGDPLSHKVSDDQLTAGLDVQHAITDNMNMDLTLNTDFAQVEADDQVVNLSRFSLFFPEKRRFFLERSSIMDFSFEGNNRLFYSRRIGINDGRISPLWGGARIVGRIGKYDVGFLNMQSRSKFDFASENFGVFRFRRKISEGNSYLGGILTSRTDFKGNLNLTYGVDGIINLFGNDYLKFNLARTSQSEDSLSYSDFFDDRKRVYVMWENRTQVGFNYSLSYSQVDAHYEPGLGFETRKSFKAFGDRLSYGWFPKKSTSLRFMNINLNVTAYFPDDNFELESVLFEPSLNFEWKKDNRLAITYSRFQDRPTEAFDLSDEVTISPGDYVNNEIRLYYQTPSVKFLNAEFEATHGSFYDGSRISASVTPTYVISKYLTLSGFYQYNYIGFDHSTDYLAHVARLKVTTSLNVKFSINTFVQVNSLSKVSVINLRLRYNPKDGNDLYLVYNEILNGKDRPQTYTDARAFLVKYVHTFHLGR